MDQETLDLETISKLYEELQSRPLEAWQNHESDEIRIATKVAHETSLEEFCAMLNENEMPTIQLSQKEMAALKGGGKVGDWIKKQIIKRVGGLWVWRF